MSASPEGLAKLREEFPPEVVGKLPRNIGDGPKRDCRVCGGYHGPTNLHLDFVGHADVTDRLLSVDPNWSWEPFALDERGLPAVDRDAKGWARGMWIKLTVCGVTRPGYGTCGSGKEDAIKELIGDALRNAAMRFGVALYLWSKTELESQISSAPTAEDADRVDNPPQVPPRPVGNSSINENQGETTPLAAVAASNNDAPVGGDTNGGRGVGEVSPTAVLQLILDLKSLTGKKRAEAMGEKTRLKITDLESLDPESEEYRLLRAKVSQVMA